MTLQHITDFFEYLCANSHKDMLEDILEVENLLLKHTFQDEYTKYRCFTEFYYYHGALTQHFKYGWRYQFPTGFEGEEKDQKAKHFRNFTLPTMISGFARRAEDIEDVEILQDLWQHVVCFYCRDTSANMAHLSSGGEVCDCKETVFVKDLFVAGCAKYPWLRENF